MFRRLFSRKIKIKCTSFIQKHLSTSEVRRTPSNPGTNVIFGKYLLATNVISSGVLMLLGDLLQQEIEYQTLILPERYDLGRLSNTSINYLLTFYLL